MVRMRTNRTTPMPDETLLPMLHELASCQHAIERYSARHVRALGLTLAQFDVVASLGASGDMTLRELSERTLITKGTLTGVVDRLEHRALLRRRHDPADGRRVFAQLAPARLERMRRDLANLRGAVPAGRAAR